MLKARKKNRIVRIPEERADEYKKLGYTLTDEEGNVVYQPEDKDATISALKLENAKLNQKIAEYELIMKGNADRGAESLKGQLDTMEKEKNELEIKLKEAEKAVDARMELFNSIREENETLKTKNTDLEEKLEEASAYAEKADKRIEELEKELAEKPEPEAEDKADGKAKVKGTAAKKK